MRQQIAVSRSAAVISRSKVRPDDDGTGLARDPLRRRAPVRTTCPRSVERRPAAARRVGSGRTATPERRDRPRHGRRPDRRGRMPQPQRVGARERRGATGDGLVPRWFVRARIVGAALPRRRPARGGAGRGGRHRELPPRRARFPRHGARSVATSRTSGCTMPSPRCSGCARTSPRSAATPRK